MFKYSVLSLLFLSLASPLCAQERKVHKPPHRMSVPKDVEVPKDACGTKEDDNYKPEPYILYVMFLTTSVTSTKSPDWALQSVTSQEYDSCASCYIAGARIVVAIEDTPTINLAGWCLRKLVPPPPPPPPDKVTPKSERGPGIPPRGERVPLGPPLQFNQLLRR